MKRKKGHQKLFNLLKVDLDMQLPYSWLHDFISTRYAILEKLGYHVESFDYEPSKRGYHFFFILTTCHPPTECNKLQWLLGDDNGRVLINARRIARGIDWAVGNKMFSKTIWRKKHKCNCSIHRKIILRHEEGQLELLKILEGEKCIAR